MTLYPSEKQKMSLRRSMSSRRKNLALNDNERSMEQLRMRLSQPLRVGSQIGTWVGRLDSKSKLRIDWKIAFGPKGRTHEITCTVSRKSKKREVFIDGDLVHSGALGLLESVGGVAADTTLFEHKWQLAGRAFCVTERVFVREGVPLPSIETDDPSGAAAAREAARFELSIDGTLCHMLDDIDALLPSQIEEMESGFLRAVASRDASLLEQVDRHDDRRTTRDTEDAAGSGASSSSLQIRQSEDEMPTKPTQRLNEYAGARMPRQTYQGASSTRTSISRESGHSSRRVISRMSSPSAGVVSDNGLGARIQCTLGPGILGGKLTLKNDETGARVEIDATSDEARQCGVSKGDVLLALNGRALPPKLDASELMSLLRANPRYMQSEVVASVWRRQLEKRSGNHVTLRLTGTGPPFIELARLEAAESSADDYEEETSRLLGYLRGLYVVVRSASSGKNNLVWRGDIVVGFDHEPTPRFATSVSLAQMAGDWAAAGKLDANLWRPSEAATANLFADLAAKADRSVLIASPSDVSLAASKSASGIWGTATIAVTVTGDGGRNERLLSPKVEKQQRVMKTSLSADKSAEVDKGSSAPRTEFQKEQHGGSRPIVAPTHTVKSSASQGNADPHVVTGVASVAAAPTQERKQPTAQTNKAALADDRNFAVFKRLLQSGATLEEIVAEMKAAGVPKETTQRIIESLRTIVAERAAKVNKHSEDAPKPKPTNTDKAAPDPRSAMLAMIAKRQGGQASSQPSSKPSAKGNKASSESEPEGEKANAALARYRKMVKLGVPPASVRQRMRMDQVDPSLVRTFSAENGLENDEPEAKGVSTDRLPKGKRAKLHWDAMTLDDSALAVSVWAADAFGDDEELEALSRTNKANPAMGGTEGLLGDDDIERLATLFSDAEKPSGRSRKPEEARKTNNNGLVPTVNGRPVANARMFEPQRSQNVLITIAPLVRAFDVVDALSCAIARMETPRVSLEQLETLRTAMPNDDEKAAVSAHVTAAASCASADELAILDSVIARDVRFVLDKARSGAAAERPQQKSKKSCAKKDEFREEASDENLATALTQDVILDRGVSAENGVVHVSSAEAQKRIRLGYVAENLAPAERFAYSIACVESALAVLRSARTSRSHQQESAPNRIQASLAKRLEALVIGLSAKPAAEALAEKADSYAKAARSLITCRELARLLKNVLAAGNAVNAGSAKAGASAVRLSSLLQAARTKGTDGKTTLLDGVVELLLDHAARKQQQDRLETVNAKSAPDLRSLDDASPRPRVRLGESGNKQDVFLKGDILDFPENDGLLTSLDAVRGADERAIVQEAAKLDGNLAVLSKEIKYALMEFGPDADDEEDPRTAPEKRPSAATFKPVGASSSSSDRAKSQGQMRVRLSLAKYLLPYGSSRQRRLAESERLTQMETDALLRTEALRKDHIEPLKAAVSELRKYFACDANEPLDAIFATIRDFLRAFCDSRDTQRRQRRAELRQAERRAAKATERSNRSAPVSGQPRAAISGQSRAPVAGQSRAPASGQTRPKSAIEGKSNEGEAAVQNSRPTVQSSRVAKGLRSNAFPVKEAKPPSHPPPPDTVDTAFAKTRRRRVAGAASSDGDAHRDVEWSA